MSHAVWYGVGALFAYREARLLKVMPHFSELV